MNKRVYLIDMEPNKIYLGDAYTLIKDIPSKSVDLIMTDPPYDIGCVGYNTGFMKDRKSGYKVELEQTNLNKGIDLSILDDLVRVMKLINIYIWCNKDQIYDYLTYFVKERKCNWEMIVWAKTNPPPFTCGHYLKDKEYCLYFWEKGIKVNPTFQTGKTFYLTNTNVYDKDDYLHPTIKDLSIVETLISNSCKDGLVLDPFVGSGTTCLAAKHLGLKWIGFEINEKYYNIAVDRLKGLNQKGVYNLFDLDYEEDN